MNPNKQIIEALVAEILKDLGADGLRKEMSRLCDGILSLPAGNKIRQTLIAQYLGLGIVLGEALSTKHKSDIRLESNN